MKEKAQGNTAKKGIECPLDDRLKSQEIDEIKSAIEAMRRSRYARNPMAQGLTRRKGYIHIEDI